LTKIIAALAPNIDQGPFEDAPMEARRYSDLVDVLLRPRKLASVDGRQRAMTMSANNDSPALL
jgi:hypothetical protein